jgi:hypothetical protein
MTLLCQTSICHFKLVQSEHSAVSESKMKTWRLKLAFQLDTALSNGEFLMVSLNNETRKARKDYEKKLSKECRINPKSVGDI